MENRKRKREPETGAPRIKYHVEQLGRSFERILKEDSHEELREVVRKKLDLSSTTRLELVQLREGRFYDLEDDDDFEAFKAAAIAYSSLDVRVSFSPQDSASTIGHPNGPFASGSTDLHKDHPTIHNKVFTVSKQTSKEVAPKSGAGRIRDIQDIAHTSGDEGDMPAPPKKKRKTDSTNVAVEKPKVTSKAKAKKDPKSKDADPSPMDQGGGQEPPKKKPKKSKEADVAPVNVVTSGASAEAVSMEKALTSKAKKPSKAKNAVPVIADADPEHPKNKRKKSKEPETGDAATSVVPMTAASTEKASVPKAKKVPKARDIVAEDQDAEPLKKKRRRSKEAENGFAPRDEATSVVSVEDVFLDKKKPQGKKKKTEVEDVGKRTKKKDVQTSGSDTPNAPSPVDVAPNIEHSSSASTTASAVSDNAKKTRTLEELFIASKAFTPIEAEPKKSSKMAKAKAPTKTPVGKSRLSESWTPGDSEESSLPRAEMSSKTPSGLAHPPLSNPAAAHPPLVKPAVATSTTAPNPAFTPVAPVPTPISPVAVPDVAAMLTPAATAPLHPLASHISPKPRGTPKSSGKQESASPCPVCLARPFHRRFLCPFILLGGSAIQKRIEELESAGGQEELVEELHEWLKRKVTKGKTGVKILTEINSRDRTGLDKTPSRGPIAAGSRDSHVSVQEWASVRPQQGRLSEVTVESRDEGSDAEESSGSDSDSSSESVTDPEDKNHQFDVDSESDSDSSSSSSSDSGPGLITRSFSIDLEHADLEEVMRGPAAKVQLAKLVAEDENGTSEEGTGLLEEEDEDDEKRRRSSKNHMMTRSSSPEAVEDDDQESEAALDIKDSSAIHQVEDSSDESSVKESTKEVSMEPGTFGAVETEVVPSDESESRPNGLHPSSGIQEADDAAVDVDMSVGERSKTPPAENLAQLPSATQPPKTPVKGLTERAPISVTKSPTTPARPSTAQTITRSPLVQQMKDRSGNLPLNPPDDEEESELPIASIVHDTSTVTAEEEIEQARRGRSRTPSQAKSTTRSTRSRSRTAGPAVSTSSTPSGAAPKRRGRPPLTDAVKAERQAIKDAERAAREAAKQEKKKAAVPRKAPNKTAKPEAVHSEHEAPPKEATPNNTQEKTLPPSTVSPSSPVVDRSVSSIPITKVNQRHELAAAAVPVGIKSPGGISVTTSASRMHDEDDVEQIVGSSKASIKENMDAIMQRSLFLPGASQMTQTQSIPNFFKRNMDERAQHSLDQQSSSSSSSQTEEETGEDEKNPPQKPTIPRSSLPSKLAFPSLSQLSFDNYRPSFLFPTRGLSQKEKQDEQQHDEESDEEEEDSSDEENNSHVPKDRIAGTGIIKKRKSRGLLGT